MDKLFERNVRTEVSDEDMNLRLKGRLEDTRLGEPLHTIEVDMLISVWEAEILEIGGAFPHHPMDECVQGLEVLQELLGHQIKPGFSELVKSKVGGPRGCSHLAALLMNMGNASIQGRGAFMRKHVPDELVAEKMLEFAEDLRLIDSCVCWREDGPLMKRWRDRLGQP